MWQILEYAVLGFIVLLFITEIFYPLIAGKPFFGSFRKNAPIVQKPVDSSLEAKLADAKRKVEEVKNVQNEVNQHFKSAEQLKDEADNLLNNSNK
jgi:membrane-associated HD superfamily phosphohydrolase